MSEDDPKAPAAPDLSTFAQDLITLWQSELSAMAADRELQEGIQCGLSLWASMAQGLTQSFTQNHEASRRPGPAAAQGSAPPAAPSDQRDAKLARLAERIAELERRLAELDRRS